MKLSWGTIEWPKATSRGAKRRPVEGSGEGVSPSPGRTVGGVVEFSPRKQIYSPWRRITMSIPLSSIMAMFSFTKVENWRTVNFLPKCTKLRVACKQMSYLNIQSEMLRLHGSHCVYVLCSYCEGHAVDHINSV